MQLLKRLKTTVSQPHNRSASSPLPTEQAYDILSNDRRRRVVAYLAGFEPGTVVDVRDISVELANQGDDRQACYVALLQSHLLQLDPREENAVSVLSYDERAKTVTVRPELHALYEAHSAFTKHLE